MISQTRHEFLENTAQRNRERERKLTRHIINHS